MTPEEAQRARSLIRALASSEDGPGLSSRVSALMGLDEPRVNIPRLRGFVQLDLEELRQKIDALGGASSAGRLLHIPVAHLHHAYRVVRTTKFILERMDELIRLETRPSPTRAYTPKKNRKTPKK